MTELTLDQLLGTATSFQITKYISIEYRGTIEYDLMKPEDKGIRTENLWTIKNGIWCYNPQKDGWQEEGSYPVYPSTNPRIKGTRYSLEQAFEIVNSPDFIQESKPMNLKLVK